MAIHGCHIFPILQAKFGDLRYQMFFFRSRNTAQLYFFWSIFSTKLSNNCLTTSNVEDLFFFRELHDFLRKWKSLRLIPSKDFFFREHHDFFTNIEKSETDFN